MNIPVASLIAIKLDLRKLLWREKTEQSILVDNEWLDTETIAIFRTWNQVFEKEQFKEFKMNFVNEIVSCVQGNRVCLTDAAYLLVEWSVLFWKFLPCFSSDR